MAVFFRTYAPVFTGIGALCTATAALFGIPVALKSMKKTDIEIKRLEIQLSEGNWPKYQAGPAGDWLDHPKVNFFLMILIDIVKAFVLLYLLDMVVYFVLSDRDSDGSVSPIWWFLRQVLLTGAAIALLWPIVRSLRRFRAIILGEPPNLHPELPVSRTLAASTKLE